MPTHRRWAVAVIGAVAFLLGLVGIAVGAGIAIPYAPKLGFTSMTVTGLVCVLSGTVLLWCGGWAVISSLRSIPARELATDKEWLSAAYGLRGELQYGLDQLLTVATDVLTDAPPPVALRESARLAAPRPVLLITAGTVADETQAAGFIQGGSPGTVQIWDVAGAGHTGPLATDPAGWEQRVTGFLDRALR